jgi:hypothetical protein
MGNNKTIGIVLLVLGIVLLLLSLAADMVGIGGAPGLGYKQIAGIIIGAIVAVIGFVLNSKK